MLGPKNQDLPALMARIAIESADKFSIEWNLLKVADVGLDKDAMCEELMRAGSDEVGIQRG